MPTYSIQAPDGKTYSVNGPPGATQADVIAEVLRQNPSAGAAPSTPALGDNEDQVSRAAKSAASASQMPGWASDAIDAVKTAAEPLLPALLQKLGLTTGRDAQGKPTLIPSLTPDDGISTLGQTALAAGTGALGKFAGDLGALSTMYGQTVFPGVAAATGADQLDPAKVKAAVQNAITYQPTDPLAQGILKVVGAPTALFDKAGGLVQQGFNEAANRVAPLPGGTIWSSLLDSLGGGAHEAITDIPQFAGVKFGPKVASAAADAADAGASKMMAVALQPKNGQFLEGSFDNAKQVMLDQGLTVNQKALDILKPQIDAGMDQVRSAAQNSNGIVSKYTVLMNVFDPIQQTLSKLGPGEVRSGPIPSFPAEAAAAVKQMRDQLEATLPDWITVGQLQGLKEGIWADLRKQNLFNKSIAVATDDLSVPAAKTDVKLGLGTEYKNQIENFVPQVKPINEAVGSMMDAYNLIEQRLPGIARTYPLQLGLLVHTAPAFATYIALHYGPAQIAHVLNAIGNGLDATGAIAGPGISAASAAANDANNTNTLNSLSQRP